MSKKVQANQKHEQAANNVDKYTETTVFSVTDIITSVNMVLSQPVLEPVEISVV